MPFSLPHQVLARGRDAKHFIKILVGLDRLKP